jgi:peptidoglycan/LPS O-acetylase OafA/YrhL
VKASFKRITIITLSLFTVSVLFTLFFQQRMPGLMALNSFKIYHWLLDSILMHPGFKYTIFLFGCLCGRFYLTAPSMKIMEKYSVPVFIISLAVIVIGYQYTSDMVLQTGILSLAYFPFVLSVCSFKGRLLQVFSWQPFIFLGEISYGIYIMQVPIEHYFEYLFTGNKSFTTNAAFFSYTLFLIVVCSILYYLYEIPLKNTFFSIIKEEGIQIYL